jgi:hypothetical protein
LDEAFAAAVAAAVAYGQITETVRASYEAGGSVRLEATR